VFCLNISFILFTKVTRESVLRVVAESFACQRFANVGTDRRKLFGQYVFLVNRGFLRSGDKRDAKYKRKNIVVIENLPEGPEAGR